MTAIKGTPLNGMISDVVFPFYTGKAGLSGDGRFFSFLGSVARNVQPADGTIDGQAVSAVSVTSSPLNKAFVVVRLAEPFTIPPETLTT